MGHALFSDVCWIIRTLKNRGYPAFIAGGAVRDILIGQNPGDYDIATTATPEVILSAFPRAKPVGRAFGTTLVIIEHRPYQITTLQSSGGTYTNLIEKDILRRDFTVNALFWDPLEDRLIDIVGGMKDLSLRLLRPVTTAERIFRDDPIRMLRAIRIAYSLGFDIDPTVFPAIRIQKERIQRISPERIQYELVKILSLPNVLEALCPLVRSRLLFEIVPEMLPLIHLKQFPYHDFSAFSHTFRVLYFVENLLHDPFFHSTPNLPPKHVLTLAALLHDIGKPDTHSTDEAGNNHFYDHEDTGAAKALEIMRRLRFPKKETILVKNIVARHLYPLHLFRHYRENTLTQRAIDRFHRKTKRFLWPLLLLSSADQLAKRRGSDGALSSIWLEFLDMLLFSTDTGRE
jgi:putative nucleotidyltransferase with HDIG domain